MKALRFVLAAAAACVAASSAFAQADASCIVAGRVSDGQWAPRLAGVQLLGANAQVVNGAGKGALAGVKQARLAQPALLSRCGELTAADGEPAGTKSQVPALSAGMVDVEAVSYSKLRTGGELVELRVRPAAERVVMLTR
jgi:hypothetical protein